MESIEPLVMLLEKYTRCGTAITDELRSRLLALNNRIYASPSRAVWVGSAENGLEGRAARAFVWRAPSGVQILPLTNLGEYRSRDPESEVMAIYRPFRLGEADLKVDGVTQTAIEIFTGQFVRNFVVNHLKNSLTGCAVKEERLHPFMGLALQNLLYFSLMQACSCGGEAVLTRRFFGALDLWIQRNPPVFLSPDNKIIVLSAR